MEIREAIGKYPARTKATSIMVIIIVLGFSIWRAKSGGTSDASRAYYSIDDGATTFVDDFFKAYPFDHDGKPAYRAYVFQTTDGKRFVGYLERYTASGLADLQALLSKGEGPEQLRNDIQNIRSHETELKAAANPGVPWLPVGSPQAEAVTSAPGATASAGGSPTMVFP